MKTVLPLPIVLSCLCLLGLLNAGCAAIPGTKPLPPKVSLIGVRPLNLSLTKQKLAFKLKVVNPNRFDLPMESLQFAASFAGQEIAKGSSDKPVTLPARGEAELEVTVNAGIVQVLERFRSMIEGGTIELDYGVKGTVKLANWPRRIPFDVVGELEDPTTVRE